MKVTKLEHATLVFEDEGKTLILDPGLYTRPLTGYSNVVAIVITHNHDDHVHEDQIEAIMKNNPEAQILSTGEVAQRFNRFSVTTVHHGDFYQLGPFTAEFFGSMHIEIHRSIPLIQNCGVMISDTVYYPGDSYTIPDLPVKFLACPASAPWLKIGDVMDFIAEVKPANTFPTHNIHLSDQGHEMNNSRIQQITTSNGGNFDYLKAGESFVTA